MKIGIDARPLSYQLTGIGYYLRSLLDALQDVDQTSRYVLISNRPIQYEIRNPNWSKQEGGCSGKLLSTAWMQAAAPVLARRLGLDLFWGTRHHLPLMLPVVVLLGLRDVVLSLQLNLIPALVVTDGGPPDYATTYLGLFVYRNAFEYLRYGYAAAATVVLVLMTAAIVVVQLWLLRRWRSALV